MKWSGISEIGVSDKVTIRRVTPFTVAEFTSIHRSIFKTSTYYSVLFMICAFLNSLNLTNSRDYIVKDSGNKAVGIITITYKSRGKIYLYNVGIVWQERLKGYARATLSHFLSRYANRKSIYLTVDSKNKKAKSLYESLGFEYIKELKK